MFINKNLMLINVFTDALEIRKDNFEVISFTSNLSNRDKSADLDVTEIQFRSGTMFYLPDGIGNIFENLQTFVLAPNLRFKHLRRSNFKNLKKLESLGIFSNDIETLDEDTLWDPPYKFGNFHAHSK